MSLFDSTTLSQTSQIAFFRDFPTWAPAILHMVAAIGYVLGVWAVLHAIFQLKRAGEEYVPGGVSVWAVLVQLGIATCLVNLPSFLDMGTSTFFGSSTADLASQNPLAYTSSSPLAYQDFWNSFMWFMRIVGLTAVVYGLMEWKSAAEGDYRSSSAKGWWHIIGGVLAFHFDALAGLFSSVFAT